MYALDIQITTFSTLLHRGTMHYRSVNPTRGKRIDCGGTRCHRGHGSNAPLPQDSLDQLQPRLATGYDETGPGAAEGLKYAFGHDPIGDVPSVGAGSRRGRDDTITDSCGANQFSIVWNCSGDHVDRV
jgi:hypothetical protein